MKGAVSAVLVPISVGELLDKISILEIKEARVKDPNKKNHIEWELKQLQKTRSRVVEPSTEIESLFQELKECNTQLWEIEDALRDCERRKDFGNQFVRLARSVYRYNDRRAAIKRTINQSLHCELQEEKIYARY